MLKALIGPSKAVVEITDLQIPLSGQQPSNRL